jgi:hypothetical protein
MIPPMGGGVVAGIMRGHNRSVAVGSNATDGPPAFARFAGPLATMRQAGAIYELAKALLTIRWASVTIASKWAASLKLSPREGKWP